LLTGFRRSGGQPSSILTDGPEQVIPEQLYGREKEIELLLGAFDRVVSEGTTELVLVSGYSGVGKSSVVNELHKALVPPRGLFASEKFDQYKRNIPSASAAGDNQPHPERYRRDEHAGRPVA
jgi:hypothetical protein